MPAGIFGFSGHYHDIDIYASNSHSFTHLILALVSLGSLQYGVVLLHNILAYMTLACLLTPGDIPLLELTLEDIPDELNRAIPHEAASYLYQA